MSLEELVADFNGKLGKETHLSDWQEVQQSMINAFADVTKDKQWIHVDVERAAKESPFNTTVAHGFLTISLITYLTGIVNASEPLYSGVKLAVNYGMNRVRFPNPVAAGSRIRSRSKLITVNQINDICLQVVNEVTIEIDGQEKPACVAEMVYRYYF